jgi:hypothetical protein
MTSSDIPFFSGGCSGTMMRQDFTCGKTPTMLPMIASSRNALRLYPRQLLPVVLRPPRPDARCFTRSNDEGDHDCSDSRPDEGIDQHPEKIPVILLGDAHCVADEVAGSEKDTLDQTFRHDSTPFVDPSYGRVRAATFNLNMYHRYMYIGLPVIAIPEKHLLLSRRPMGGRCCVIVAKRLSLGEIKPAGIRICRSIDG